MFPPIFVFRCDNRQCDRHFMEILIRQIPQFCFVCGKKQNNGSFVKLFCDCLIAFCGSCAAAQLVNQPDTYMSRIECPCCKCQMDMCDMITHRRVQSEKIQAWVYKDVFLHEQFKKIDDREWDLLEYIGKKLNMPVVQKTDDMIIKGKRPPPRSKKARERDDMYKKKFPSLEWCAGIRIKLLELDPRFRAICGGTPTLSDLAIWALKISRIAQLYENEEKQIDAKLSNMPLDERDLPLGPLEDVPWKLDKVLATSINIIKGKHEYLKLECFFCYDKFDFRTTYPGCNM